jgi:hypothetical protein
MVFCSLFRPRLDPDIEVLGKKVPVNDEYWIIMANTAYSMSYPWVATRNVV